MAQNQYIQAIITCALIHQTLNYVLNNDKHINSLITSRKLREAGFREFELTSVKELIRYSRKRLDAASLHRRQRSAERVDDLDVEILAFGESYRMVLQHSKSVLHPSAKILTVNNDVETEWTGEHPDCFLTGYLYSHNGSASASFCNELRGMMTANEHELHFEILPHDIRKRSTLRKEGHTTLVARKNKDMSRLSALKLENDFIDVEEDRNNYRKVIRKRAVPSTSFTIEMAVYCDADFMANDIPSNDTNERIEMMVVKYNAVQMEWGREDQLGYNVTLSIKLMGFLDTNPAWYNTSSDLLVPLSTICSGTSGGLPYDHVHVHTGVANPALGGLAWQSKVCKADYRCAVSADSLTTYVVTAHELGHNMGMYHDSDRGCTSPDVGNMGGAGVGWSTCSANDMNTMLQTGNHGCLWTDDIADNTIDPAQLQSLVLYGELPGQTYTGDEICEKFYGSGFRYREYPNLDPTSCNIYSCVDHNFGNTHGRMFRQSQSVAGLYCEDYKICLNGACQNWSAAQLSNLEVRAGGWSNWGSWTTCTRTCGRGMIYRRRKCDNPTPKNHAFCDGGEYEAQACNITPCPDDSSTESVLINQRASETCQYLIDNNIINGSLYTAVGSIYSQLNHGDCEVHCDPVDGYTVPAQTRFGLMDNGTPCPGTLDEADRNQYSRRPGFYYACLEGYCQRFDCANTLDSGTFDRCGVCNGNNDTCLIREGNFTDYVNRYTRTTWTTIPVGAYDIEISFEWSTMKQYYIEIHTKEGMPLIASNIVGDSRIFETGDNPVSFGGTLWHFYFTKQIMYAEGPLDAPVVVKIYNLQENNNTGINYIYSVPLNIDSCTGTCDNGGTWKTDMCACDCTSGYTGTFCSSQCSTLCKNGAPVNESTCECSCNEKQYGSKCDCRYPFTGGNCDTCKQVTCENCGVFNATTCRCQCPSGYGGLQCESLCADITDSATCAADAAAGNCISDNINMEQNCMASCGLCVVKSPPDGCSPTNIVCTVGYMTCFDNSACVSYDKKCDGSNDCTDGSDEGTSVCSGQSQIRLNGFMIFAILFYVMVLLVY